MTQYIDKSALVAEIESLEHTTFTNFDEGVNAAVQTILGFINTLEVKDPYEQCIQYDSIKAGIQAHAETYSFNIESELFNQLTKEQQVLWRKEIEQAYISGGDAGVTLARDARYKENLEVKEVDLEKEIENLIEKEKAFVTDNREVKYYNGDSFNHIYELEFIAKHFFKLGVKARKEE